MKICVVFGGNGGEKDVSFSSSRAILRAIEKLGYDFCELNFDGNFLEKIVKIKPNVVFNAMHGTFGEDGCLPLLLDFLKIPYTHSGRKASIIAMNKQLTKQIAKNIGVPILKSEIYSSEQILKGEFINFGTSFVKPLEEGSTLGCFKLEGGSLNEEQKQIVASIGGFFIVEEFFDGFDATIGIMGEKAIGGVEIRPLEGFYNYTAKYTKGKTEYFCPPRISKNLLEKMQELTLKLHKTIGAKGVSRADFLIKGEEFRFLEINTHPGFTETSLVPKMALQQGISFEKIVDFLIKDASFQHYEK